MLKHINTILDKSKQLWTTRDTKKPVLPPFFNIIPKHDPKVSADIQANSELLSELSCDRKNLLNLLLWFQRTNMPIYASQEWFGKKIGASREWVNKIIREFTQMGILMKNYRHEQTCGYRVSSFFQDSKMRAILGKHFSNLSAFAVLLLTSPNLAFNDSIDKKFTLFSFNNYKYINKLNYSFSYPPKSFKKELKEKPRPAMYKLYLTKPLVEEHMSDWEKLKIYEKELTELLPVPSNRLRKDSLEKRIQDLKNKHTNRGKEFWK